MTINWARLAIGIILIIQALIISPNRVSLVTIDTRAIIAMMLLGFAAVLIGLALDTKKEIK